MTATIKTFIVVLLIPALALDPAAAAFNNHQYPPTSVSRSTVRDFFINQAFIEPLLIAAHRAETQQPLQCRVIRSIDSSAHLPESSDDTPSQTVENSRNSLASTFSELALAHKNVTKNVVAYFFNYIEETAIETGDPKLAAEFARYFKAFQETPDAFYLTPIVSLWLSHPELLGPRTGLSPRSFHANIPAIESKFADAVQWCYWPAEWQKDIATFERSEEIPQLGFFLFPGGIGDTARVMWFKDSESVLGSLPKEMKILDTSVIDFVRERDTKAILSDQIRALILLRFLVYIQVAEKGHDSQYWEQWNALAARQKQNGGLLESDYRLNLPPDVSPPVRTGPTMAEKIAQAEKAGKGGVHPDLYEYLTILSGPDLAFYKPSITSRHDVKNDSVRDWLDTDVAVRQGDSYSLWRFKIIRYERPPLFAEYSWDAILYKVEIYNKIVNTRQLAEEEVHEYAEEEPLVRDGVYGSSAEKFPELVARGVSRFKALINQDLLKTGSIHRLKGDDAPKVKQLQSGNNPMADRLGASLQKGLELPVMSAENIPFDFLRNPLERLARFSPSLSARFDRILHRRFGKLMRDGVKLLGTGSGITFLLKKEIYEDLPASIGRDVLIFLHQVHEIAELAIAESEETFHLGLDINREVAACVVQIMAYAGLTPDERAALKETVRRLEARAGSGTYLPVLKEFDKYNTEALREPTTWDALGHFMRRYPALRNSAISFDTLSRYISSLFSPENPLPGRVWKETLEDETTYFVDGEFLAARTASVYPSGVYVYWSRDESRLEEALTLSLPDGTSLHRETLLIHNNDILIERWLDSNGDWVAEKFSNNPNVEQLESTAMENAEWEINDRPFETWIETLVGSGPLVQARNSVYTPEPEGVRELAESLGWQNSPMVRGERPRKNDKTLYFKGGKAWIHVAASPNGTWTVDVCDIRSRNEIEFMQVSYDRHYQQLTILLRHEKGPDGTFKDWHEDLRQSAILTDITPHDIEAAIKGDTLILYLSERHIDQIRSQGKTKIISENGSHTISGMIHIDGGWDVQMKIIPTRLPPIEALMLVRYDRNMARFLNVGQDAQTFQLTRRTILKQRWTVDQISDALRSLRWILVGMEHELSWRRIVQQDPNSAVHQWANSSGPYGNSVGEIQAAHKKVNADKKIFESILNSIRSAKLRRTRPRWIETSA